MAVQVQAWLVFNEADYAFAARRGRTTNSSADAREFETASAAERVAGWFGPGWRVTPLFAA